MNLLENYSKRLAVSESVFAKEHNGEKMSREKQIVVKVSNKSSWH